MKLKGIDDNLGNLFRTEHIFYSLEHIQNIFGYKGKEKQNSHSVWVAESVIGAIGTILNSICLSIFLIGRDHLLGSVNATIW